MIGSHTEFAQRRLQDVGFGSSQSDDSMRRKRRKASWEWQTRRRSDFKINDGNERVRVSLTAGREAHQVLRGPARANSNTGLSELALQRRSPARTTLGDNDLTFGHCGFTQQIGLLGPRYSSSKFIPRRT